MDEKLKRRLAGAGVLLAMAFVLVSLLPTPGKVDAPPPDEVVTIPLYEERTETPLPPSSAALPPSLAAPTVADGDGTATQDVEGTGDDDGSGTALVDEVPSDIAAAAVDVKPLPKPKPKPEIKTVPAPKPPQAQSKPAVEARPKPVAPVTPALPPKTPVVQAPPAAPVEKPAPRIEAPPAVAPRPTAATLATKPVAPRAEAWFVQIGSFADIANARQVQDRLKAAGQASILSPIDTAQGTLYRVRIGPFASREAAAPTLARATSAGFAAAKLASP